MHKKTSLLLALLGEIINEPGEIRAVGRLFFVAQTPWMFDETIRNNIVFYNEQIEENYIEAIEKCGLQKVI